MTLDKICTMAAAFETLKMKWPDLCNVCEEELGDVNLLIATGDARALKNQVIELQRQLEDLSMRCNISKERELKLKTLMQKRAAAQEGEYNEKAREAQEQFEAELQNAQTECEKMKLTIEHLNEDLRLERARSEILQKRLKTEEEAAEKTKCALQTKHELATRRLNHKIEDLQRQLQAVTTEREKYAANEAALKKVLYKMMQGVACANTSDALKLRCECILLRHQLDATSKGGRLLSNADFSPSDPQ